MRRSSLELTKKLIKLVTPLTFQMIVAIILGSLGYILSFGIGILGGYALLTIMPDDMKKSFDMLFLGGKDVKWYLMALLICAVLRGIFHYIEQFFNHYIAFRILAELRKQVFAAMRNLAPAKLEGKNQGKLISLIMGDIELLEVFYAHTISPTMIAIVVTVFLMYFYSKIHIIVALVALMAYVVVGVVLPMYASKKGEIVGVNIRENLSLLNGEFLDKLRGIREVIQYNAGEDALDDIYACTKNTLENQTLLKDQVADVQANTDSLIIVFGLIQAAVCFWLKSNGQISSIGGFLAVFAQISTFGPYIALANLGSTLTQTFACGDRIIDLLEESPVVEKQVNGVNADFEDLRLSGVSFSYDEIEILKNVDLAIKKGETLGIMGKSGSGKSTILKLIMRFWDPKQGSISINGIDIKNINTESLYDNIDYMTQTTVLFSGTIRDNLIIAKKDATDEELFEALRKASIDEYIRGLKDGLDTRVSDLGDNFSGGERQRIGLARCFLTNSKLLLLDEPTSNLDAFNEAVILKALVESVKDRAVILVSHRESTMGVCDRVIKISDINNLDKIRA